MGSPSAIITLGLNYTPSLMLSMGYGAGEAAAHVPTRLVFSRVRVVTALTLDSVEKD